MNTRLSGLNAIPSDIRSTTWFKNSIAMVPQFPRSVWKQILFDYLFHIPHASADPYEVLPVRVWGEANFSTVRLVCWSLFNITPQFWAMSRLP